MNILKEAHSVFDFATYYPLLCKATADNDSTTPGHTQEEVIKISFLSHQHRIHLVDFLLSKLSHLGWSGKQKATVHCLVDETVIAHSVVRLLHHLCQRGHCEVRVLLRQKDGVLREAASHGGPPDPVLDSTPQLFFTSLIQELRSYIFDPAIVKADEGLMLAGENQQNMARVTASGYGASADNKGKYEGFGSTPFSKQDSIVDQMIDMVGKVVTSESRRRGELEGLLKGDKGHYQPLSLTSIASTAPVAANASQMNTSAVPPLYASIISPRNRPHVAGKVGGDWASDNEDGDSEDGNSNVFTERVLPHGEVSAAMKVSEGQDPQQFISNLLRTNSTWPVDLDEFILMCRDCTLCNSFQLLTELIQQIKINLSLSSEEASSGEHHDASPFEEPPANEKSSESLRMRGQHNLLILLLFIEYALIEDLMLVTQLDNYLDDMLVEIHQSSVPNLSVKAKAKKIHLIFKGLLT